MKAKCIFACRFWKQFLSDELQLSLLSFYTAVSINPIFKIRSLPKYISIVNTPYTMEGIQVIRKYLHMKGFPNMNSKSAYESLKEKFPPTIQQIY